MPNTFDYLGKTKQKSHSESDHKEKKQKFMSVYQHTELYILSI